MARKKTTKTKYPGVHRVEGERGAYIVRVRITDPRTGKSRQVEREITATSGADAARQREELREASREVVAQSRRVLQCAASWLHSKKPTLKTSTVDTYTYAIDRFCELFGDVEVAELTRYDLEHFRDSHGGKPNSANNRLRVIKTMMKDFYAFGHIDRDITVGLKSLAVGPPEREKHIPAADLRALLARMKERYPQWHAITLLLATSGMRWCEASALQWGDIDLEAGSLHIARSQVRKILGPPKTEYSRRTLPLAPHLIDELRSMRVDAAKRGDWSAESWVFPSDADPKDGHPLSYNSALYKPLDRVTKELGIDKVRPHDFRYTWNQALRRAAEGIVQRSMTGHTTEAMADRYDRVTIEEKRGAMVAALELLGPREDENE